MSTIFKIFISFVILATLSSCKQNYYTHNGSGVNRYVKSPYGPEVTYEVLYPNANLTSSYMTTDTEDSRVASSEKSAVCKLMEKIKLGKDVQKNEKQLQELSKYLQNRFDDRVSQRNDFLADFYKDLYSLDIKSFSSKYKKHCSRKLLSQMKDIYLKNHEEANDGYAWVVFGDNRQHSANDISITYLNGQKNSVNQQYAEYIYDDYESDEKTEGFPYYNQEDKWYQVGMGGNNVLVKVEGEGKHIAITGVVNPLMNVWIKTQYDR